jgi:hypothetical protein
METMLLSDPEQYPTEEIIYSHIGKAKSLWLELFEYIRIEQPEMTAEWRYYRDGKSWLLKATLKKKTIFWLALEKDAFRTTFYFTDKAEVEIEASSLSEELKSQFRAGKHYGKLRALTITYTRSSDVQAARILIPLKIKMK